MHICAYVLPTCIYAHTLLFSSSVPSLWQVPLSRDFPRQEYWSWLPFPSPGAGVGGRGGGLPHLEMGPVSPALQADCLPLSHPGSENMYICAVLRLDASVLSWLYDPMDCSPQGCSVHGILQARITGVGCHALLQGIFLTRDLTDVSYISCIGRQVLYH